MVTQQSLEQQLKRIHFNYHPWGRGEVGELPNILMPDEEIYECVNGIYEGGFALLVATDVRVLLIDKKPLNYLTVEDLRFDMINEIDYSHRLMGARISIATGFKNLKFTSYNQQRLRKLITHVQHCMAELKKKQTEHQAGQNQHLEQINQQLQAYLLAQHQSQQKLQKQLHATQSQPNGQYVIPEPDLVRPAPELSDYLFAQSLLAQHNASKRGTVPSPRATASTDRSVPAVPMTPSPESASQGRQTADLYAEGVREIFGNHSKQTTHSSATHSFPISIPSLGVPRFPRHPLETSPLSIAYSKLPMALRNRKFGRPSFHAHSQAPATSLAQTRF